jgi:hypothetical protein
MLFPAAKRAEAEIGDAFCGACCALATARQFASKTTVLIQRNALLFNASSRNGWF